MSTHAQPHPQTDDSVLNRLGKLERLVADLAHWVNFDLSQFNVPPPPGQQQGQGSSTNVELAELSLPKEPDHTHTSGPEILVKLEEDEFLVEVDGGDGDPLESHGQGQSILLGDYPTPTTPTPTSSDEDGESHFDVNGLKIRRRRPRKRKFSQGQDAQEGRKLGKINPDGEEDPLTLCDSGEEEGNASASTQLIVATDFHSFTEQFAKFQALAFHKLDTISNDIIQLRRERGGGGGGDSIDAGYPLLPLKTDEELETAEGCVKDPEILQKLVDELKRVGGLTMNKNVYNILRHLLSPDLASTLRYTDKSGKKAFGQLLISKAVIAAIQSTWGPEATNKVVNELMGKYFRNINPRRDQGQGPGGHSSVEQVGEDSQSQGIYGDIFTNNG